MTAPSAPALSWFKSSYSGGSGTECVECVRSADGTFVRDSKCVRGPVVAVRRQAWRVFIGALNDLRFEE
ncbi:DUF397 domain-containing protein [Streptomyces sp. GQFP]|uniref:DUF397 domain-containing protein n=1 Tax=Streptomyces sp. GQFP TaxID=2907545 RepID=UPI001F447628|nr:DUF397 domain-containing protein [Streptomyces sp. GQFP]UIX33818.1 DUF397 domain-containing protein [Streptomyces sp. GQFP]